MLSFDVFRCYLIPKVLDLVVSGNKMYKYAETSQDLTVINNLKHAKQQMCPVFELGLSGRE